MTTMVISFPFIVDFVQFLGKEEFGIILPPALQTGFQSLLEIVCLINLTCDDLTIWQIYIVSHFR